MFNAKKFFSKRMITGLIVGVVILALLIVLTATGVMHNEVDCHDCDTAVMLDCKTCKGLGVVDCPECKDLIDKSGCETCGGEGYITCKTCEGAKQLTTYVITCDCDEEELTTCSHCKSLETPDTNCALCNGTGKMVCKDHVIMNDINGNSVKVAIDKDEKIIVCDSCGGAGTVQGSFWAIIPPIIAIGLALITKEVFSSLFIGILSGAILAADFNPLATMDNVVSTGIIGAVADTAGIFVFLIELGLLVILINKAGGSRAFGEWAETHVKSRVGAAICTFVLGILIFIDDYFNCLTVGSVMRPVTDKHKISRSKLAYLIDATAAPICMIAPISSWAAAVSQYAADGQGFNLFIAAIPMNFYSILTLVFVLGLILMKFDFGPMKKHEENAMNGDLFSGKQVKREVDIPNSKGRVFDLIIPVALLIISCVFALLYVGGIFDGATMIEAFADTDATVGLPWGGLIALVVTIIYLAARRVMSFKEIMESIPKGFMAMVPAILVLTFATALKNMTGILGAKYYIADLMYGVPDVLQKLLPAIIFLVACVLAFATGTSWGTFGILIPIITFMYPEGSGLFVLGISACLAGAVCGDHCSPISDTTIMSSAGAECEHLNHVSTQLPYAIFVAVVSFVCFVIAGFIPTWYIMLPLSIAIMVGALFITKYVVLKKKN